MNEKQTIFMGELLIPISFLKNYQNSSEELLVPKITIKLEQIRKKRIFKKNLNKLQLLEKKPNFRKISEKQKNYKKFKKNFKKN